MADVLIYADTVRSGELRHEVPLGIADPFLYVERNGSRHLVIGSLELPRLKGLGFELHPYEEFGVEELRRSGIGRLELQDEIAVRAVRKLGVTDAVVPAGFPLLLADKLRASGVSLRAEHELFVERRRVKGAAELAGIRKAQAAAEAGMAAARDLLHRAEADGAGLAVDGAPLTSERLKAAIAQAFLERGATCDEFIVSHGAQTAIGHEMGHGSIHAGEPVVFDLFPRDRATGMYSDMTRTYVVGEPPAELVEWHRLCKEALDRVVAAAGPGVNGRDLMKIAADLFAEHGHPTQFTKRPGEVLDRGFFHSLGHGVGLEVHERPWLGRVGDDLVEGDVIALEPGLYRPGFGGVRLEDVAVVTSDGVDVVTSYAYALQP